MRSLFFIPLTLLLIACDDSAEQRERYERDATLARPCVDALSAEVSKTSDPDYRGFRFADARPSKLGANHYVIDIAYQVVTLSNPDGAWPRHALCELRDGQVITLRNR